MHVHTEGCASICAYVCVCTEGCANICAHVCMCTQMGHVNTPVYTCVRAEGV